MRQINLLTEMIRARRAHLAGSEQRERLLSMSRQAPLGQGLSALVRDPWHMRVVFSTLRNLPTRVHC
jgi:hypothetical protein